MSAKTPAERRSHALRQAPLPDADATLIAAFLDATWAESGLARATLDSYRRDLEGFARWRDGRGEVVEQRAARTGEGYSPRSADSRRALLRGE